MSRTEALLRILLVLLMVSVYSIKYWMHRPEVLAASRPVFIPPPEQLPYFTFGYDDPMADSLWIRVIQNLDQCGKDLVERSQQDKVLQVAPTSGESVKSEDDELDFFQRSMQSTRKEQICLRGWSYRLMDMITRLAPRFRVVYSLGAPALSVMTEDHVGAKLLFDRGVKNFPQDWVIHYRAAYHYLYEIGDWRKAAGLLSKASTLGAPIWVQSLASRLYTKGGQLALGIITLSEYLKKIEDPDYKKKIAARLERLQRELEKQKNSK